LAKGETVVDAVSRLRSRIAELKDNIETVEKAPTASETKKARIAEEVRKVAQRGEPRILGDGTVSWPLKERRMALVAEAVLPQPAPPEKPIKHPVPREVWQKIMAGQEEETPGPAVARVTGFAGGMEDNALSFIAWLFEPQIVERLQTLVVDVDGAISPQQRATRLADLAAELLQSERMEISLIEEAAGKGLGLDYRPDTDARALLQVQ
jgi:hypothetical protein